jgi:hypothetical protein
LCEIEQFNGGCNSIRKKTCVNGQNTLQQKEENNQRATETEGAKSIAELRQLHPIIALGDKQMKLSGKAKKVWETGKLKVGDFLGINA